MSDWYYARDDQQRGPIAFEALQRLAAEGQLTGADLVWTEGMAQWTAAGLTPGLIPAPSAPPVDQASAFAGQHAPAGAASATPMPISYQPVPTAPSRHAGLAQVGMILSLISFLFGGPFLAVPGAICGWIALKGMRQTGNFEKRGFALTALWIGVAWIALTLIAMAWFFARFSLPGQHP